MRWGVDTRKVRRDRLVLERDIFPALQRDLSVRSILFVGCAWYTLHYPWLFRDKIFWTLEIDPGEACYGADRHIVASCESIGTHFPRGELDCVILNGVFGFGLNSPEALDRTLRGIHDALRSGGLFIFGWNDLPAHAPFLPFTASEWSRFAPIRFPPLDSPVCTADPVNHHAFHFFAARPTPSTE
jgi:hypothetical protein